MSKEMDAVVDRGAVADSSFNLQMSLAPVVLFFLAYV